MAIMDRKEKVFEVKNISHLKENLMFLSKSKENVILLDSNSKKNDYEFIFSYGKISELKSSDNSLEKIDNYIKLVNDWIFGFISYDLKDEIEDLNSKNLKYFDVPNLSFFQPSTIWISDGIKLKALYFDEKELFEDWVLTAYTHFYPSGWKNLFKRSGYVGEFYWTFIKGE